MNSRNPSGVRRSPSGVLPEYVEECKVLICPQEGQQDSGLDAPMEVDGNNEAAGAVIAPPAWLAKTNMPEYLCGITNDKAWQELVSSLYRFESLNTTAGVSPCRKLIAIQCLP